MKQNSKIAKTNPFYILGVIFIHRKTVFPGLRLLKVIWIEFFWPQYKTKFFGNDKDVPFIDHPLDDHIEFSLNPIKKYLSFVHLWFKTLGFLYKNLGKQVVEDIGIFLVEMTVLYQKSGAVYREIKSTTLRPPRMWKPQYLILRALDPHYHCLPSLHVLIVCFNYIKFDYYLKKYKKESKQYQKEKQYVYNEAIRITESVLIVKQHSVNCIAASLSLLSSFYPEFSRDDVEQFVQELFPDDLNNDGIQELKLFLFQSYKDFLYKLENRTGTRQEIFIDFIKSYLEEPMLVKTV